MKVAEALLAQPPYLQRLRIIIVMLLDYFCSASLARLRLQLSAPLVLIRIGARIRSFARLPRQCAVPRPRLPHELCVASVAIRLWRRIVPTPPTMMLHAALRAIRHEFSRSYVMFSWNTSGS